MNHGGRKVTVAETIEAELLDAAVDPARLAEVFAHHGKSKGPFYIALARATATLRERFVSHANEFEEAQARAEADLRKLQEQHRRVRDQASAARKALSGTERERTAKEKHLSKLVHEVDRHKEPLEQAERLGKMSFGPDRLRQLHALLHETAASQGLSAEQGVAKFFEFVGTYAQVVALELEAKRAETAAAKARAEVERWEAEAQAAEIQCKARKSTIDALERLLEAGVRSSDLSRWTAILGKAGLSVENVAGALVKYGDLERARRARRDEIATLEDQLAQLAAQAAALRQERDAASAAIAAVRDHVIRAVREVAGSVKEEVESLSAKAQEYQLLAVQAGLLQAELTLARAFVSDDRDQWAQVPRHVVQRLLAGLVAWTSAKPDHNTLVDAPDAIRPNLMFYTSPKMPLSSLLIWAWSGSFSPEERKALATRT